MSNSARTTVCVVFITLAAVFGVASLIHRSFTGATPQWVGVVSGLNAVGVLYCVVHLYFDGWWRR